MSILGKAILYVLKEVTQPALENFGKHVGDAIGTVVGRRIQPDHEDGGDDDENEDEDIDDESDEDEEQDDDVEDEDERTP
jgi:hypothetical protein